MNAHETEHQRRVADIGCIACLLDGVESPHVSIHHVHGRTKKGVHLKVLPLCAAHHQAGAGGASTIAVHPNKARFEALYGPQDSLLALVDALLGGLFTQHDLLLFHKGSDK